MHLSKYFMKTFLVLAFFSISYTITSLYVLYSQYKTALPAFFKENDSIPKFFPCSHPIEDNFLAEIDAAQKPENSIFFHETACQSFLRYREACSVESAARAHPKRQVFVSFAKSLTVTDCNSGAVAELAKLPNVHFRRMNLNTYTQLTPLENIPLPRLAWIGKWSLKKTGELFKIMSLYKFAGAVIDLDMMVVGSLDKLGDAWASREGDRFVSSIISVTRVGLSGNYYSQQFFKALSREIEYDLGSSMESALKVALQLLCNTTDVRQMKREKCKGFQVYSSEFFTSGNRSWHDLKPANAPTGYLGYYLWREPIGRRRVATMPMDSLYASLAKQYCPMVFSQFMSVGNGSVIHL